MPQRESIAAQIEREGDKVAREELRKGLIPAWITTALALSYLVVPPISGSPWPVTIITTPIMALFIAYAWWTRHLVASKESQEWQLTSALMYLDDFETIADTAEELANASTDTDTDTDTDTTEA